jgi:hypothetical protein
MTTLPCRLTPKCLRQWNHLKWRHQIRQANWPVLNLLLQPEIMIQTWHQTVRLDLWIQVRPTPWELLLTVQQLVLWIQVRPTPWELPWAATRQLVLWHRLQTRMPQQTQQSLQLLTVQQHLMPEHLLHRKDQMHLWMHLWILRLTCLPHMSQKTMVRLVWVNA